MLVGTQTQGGDAGRVTTQLWPRREHFPTCTFPAAPSGSLLVVPFLALGFSCSASAPDVPLNFPLLSPVSDSVGSQPWEEPGRAAAGSFPERRRPRHLGSLTGGRLQAQGLDQERGVSLPERGIPGHSELPQPVSRVPSLPCSPRNTQQEKARRLW